MRCLAEESFELQASRSQSFKANIARAPLATVPPERIVRAIAQPMRLTQHVHNTAEDHAVASATIGIAKTLLRLGRCVAAPTQRTRPPPNGSSHNDGIP
jgi:hypothetical protein